MNTFTITGPCPAQITTYQITDVRVMIGDDHVTYIFDSPSHTVAVRLDLATRVSISNRRGTWIRDAQQALPY